MSGVLSETSLVSRRRHSFFCRLKQLRPPHVTSPTKTCKAKFTGADIAAASEKVDEMLRDDAAADTPGPEAVTAPLESKRSEEPVKPSPSKPQDLNLKWRFPRQRQNC